MIECIKQELKTWSWERQKIWNIPIPVLLKRIEDWCYKTKELKLNLEVYNLGVESFSCENLFEFLTHYELVKKSSLKYPVIINNAWQVVDWRHRICKAISLWIKEISAIQILNDSIY